MRILLVGAGLYPREVGGAQTHMYHTAWQLARDGHEVCAVVLRRGSGSETEERTEELDGFRVLNVTLPADWWGGALDASNQATIGLSSILVSAIRRHKPEVMHLFKVTPGFRAMLDASVETGVPTVLTALNFSYLCARGSLERGKSLCDGLASEARCNWCLLSRNWVWETALGNTLGKIASGPVGRALLPARERAKVDHVRQVGEQWRRLCSLPVHVIAPSRVMSRMFALNGFPPGRIHDMTYGVPDALVQRRDPKTASNHVRFAYLGKISQYKGVHLAVQAARIAADTGASFSLHIYGPLNPEENEYHRGIQRQVLEHHRPSAVAVRFMGRYGQEQLPDILAETDVTLFTSLWPENATISVLEALALRTPVLAANVEGVAEFIREGENGWLFPRGDVSALARAMTALALQPETVRKRVEATRPILTMSEMTRRLAGLYASLTTANA